MIFIRILLAGLITGAFLWADPGDDKVWEGVIAFYDYRTEEAIEILGAARVEYPDNPAVHFTWAAARWRHSQANEPILRSYSILKESLNEVIPVYRDLVERYPESPVYRLYLGSSMGLMARVHLGKKEWFQTLAAAYKGFRIIRKVAEEDPDLKDSNLPIGIVEYYAGMSNILIKWAVEIFGLEPSRDRGRAKIELAANESEWAWIEAKAVAAFIDLWLGPEPELALKHSRDLALRFPNNYYFNILYVESLLQSGKLVEAKKIIEELKVKYELLTDIQKHWYLGYLRYEQALYSFKMGNLDTALEMVNNAIAVYAAELDMTLSSAWLLKGKILDLKDDRSAALAAYRQCRELKNNSQAEKIASRLLETPYRHGLSIDFFESDRN